MGLCRVGVGVRVLKYFQQRLIETIVPRRAREGLRHVTVKRSPRHAAYEPAVRRSAAS